MIQQLLPLTITITILAIGLGAMSEPQPRGLQSFKLDLPANSKLKVPRGLRLKYLTLGIGVRDYSCKIGNYLPPAGSWSRDLGETGTWFFTGSRSKLYDVSSKVVTAKSIPDQVIKTPHLIDLTLIGTQETAYNGKYTSVFYISNGFINSTQNVITTPSPFKSNENIDWAQFPILQTDGFAKTVLRTSTAGGQPQGKTCKINDQQNVKFAALFTFWE